MFEYSSSRARLARTAVILDQKWLQLVLRATIIILFVSWIGLVWVLHIPAGHGLLIPLSWLVMLEIWYKVYLKRLPIDPASKDITGTLERGLLGKLPKNPTPQQVIKIAGSQPGGQFFGARFAISAEFLARNVSDHPADMNKVWAHAKELASQTGEEGVSSAAVFAALLLSLPDVGFYLAQLKLDEDDIVAGLAWHQHITEVIANAAAKKSHGGLGRDLSFGWAPLLNKVGLNLSEQIERGGLLHREIEGHEDVMTQMIHLLSETNRRNVALVGEVGVGKTTLVHAFAQRLLEDKKLVKGLAYNQIVELDAANLIANARGRGELEQLLIRLLNEAVQAQNIILFLDEAQLFLKEGTGSVDLSNILLPVLEGGGIRLILSMSEQQWLELSQNNPGLAQLLNRVVVKPLGPDDTFRVIEDQVLLLEVQHKVTYMYQSLREAYKLADRYVREQAMPGKAIRLLEAAASYPEQKYFITFESVQTAVEKNFDVKVQTANTGQEKDMLLNLEGKIHERMINQTRAVQVVSDALRRARAGVRNQDRPIGTFLFLGPTGVGKTELAKSLAAVYFGGEGRVVRLDLNEFSQPQDVNRLIATPSQNPNSLTALVSKQPFSVVLLDEIEKANPNVLNTLLQMLDEGILRDADNKQVSFKDAIIIATSNAGADIIRGHIEKGESLEQFEDAFVDELINKQVFRPEFLNRFDEVVLFRPLTKDELVQVVDLIVKSINRTLAGQKVSVKLTEKAKQLLAEAGYDPRLGARPLRRVAQRSIENVLAQKLLGGTATPCTVITLDAPELQAALDKRKI
jgi:ATP-dependent Clp protease ATP-binding subunit ClpC